jgi:hypothetical protein
MRATAAPATNWRENVAPDEATRYKDYAQLLAGLQSAATRKLGRAGRALHRKGHVGAAASFEVLGDIMRARNVAYRVSTQARKADAEPDGSERFD